MAAIMGGFGARGDVHACSSRRPRSIAHRLPIRTM
jgi:hypothetical protein